MGGVSVAEDEVEVTSMGRDCGGSDDDGSDDAPIAGAWAEVGGWRRVLMGGERMGESVDAAGAEVELEDVVVVPLVPLWGGAGGPCWGLLEAALEGPLEGPLEPVEERWPCLVLVMRPPWV